MGFPGGLDSNEPASNAGDLGSIPGLGRSPGGGHGYPLQYSCLENPHEQKSLAGYSPWCRKDSDVTEGLSTAQPYVCGSVCRLSVLLHWSCCISSPGIALLESY